MAAVIVIPDGPAVQVLPGENTAQATASAALAQAWAEGTEPGGSGTDSAKGWAEAAADAAALVKYEREIAVIETNGIIPAIVRIATSIPATESYGRLYVEREAGTGTATATITRNSAPLYGPFTISGTVIDVNPAISAVAGSNLDLVIETVTGTINAFYLKLERA